jgi:ELWxxDGT repeat protein
MVGPCKHIFSAIAALILCGFSAFSQLESLSEIDIPRDKVFFIEGDLAVGADFDFVFESLAAFDLKSGQVYSSLDKVVRKNLKHGSTHYFQVFENSFADTGKVYILDGNQFLPLASNEPIYDLFTVSGIDGVIATYSQGFYLISEGQVIETFDLGERLLSLKSLGEEILGLTSSFYHILDEDLFTIESFSLPEGLKSFQGATLNEVLLLAGESTEEYTRPLYIYNIATSEVHSVVDSTGTEVLPSNFTTPKGSIGNYFFIAGSGQKSFAPFTHSHPTDAGFINVENGIYTSANFRPGLWQNVVQPAVSYSENGAIAFGRFGMEGIEPYSLNDQQIKLVKDIYPGFGGSVDLLTPSTLLYPTSHTRPPVFEMVERNGIVYFVAVSPLLGRQVWRTDGTEDGTYAITDFDLENKGPENCFLSLVNNQVIIATKLRNGSRKLYSLGQISKPIIPELDKELNWEASYVRNPNFYGGTKYLNKEHPGVHLAEDGSSLLVLNRTDMWQDVLSYSHPWALRSNRIQGIYSRTVIQTINADGTLRASATIRAREDQQRTIGRAYDSGHIYALISHRPADTWVNEEPLFISQEGHYLIELDELGREIKSTFLPTGGKDRISFAQVKVTSDAIYILGMADRNFDLGGAYSNNINQGKLRAAVLKYSLDHELLWVADSGLDQDIFGSGLQEMEVSDESVFISSGGTSYSVSSSCGFSNWPYQISRFDAETGQRKWRQILTADDVTRITSLNISDDQLLWAGGYTRGNLSAGNNELDLVSNHLNCPMNDFVLTLNAESGEVARFFHTDVTRPKLIQDTQVDEDYFYALSMVYEEERFPVPIYGHQGLWTLQLDKYTHSGLMVDSVIWPTSISRLHFSDRLREHQFSFDFHPEGGVVISATNLANGTIDGFYSPSSEDPVHYNFNSWLIQRREIRDLENASPPPMILGGGEFAVFPNPVTDNSFGITLPEEDVNSYNQLIIRDIQGRPCASQNLEGSLRTRFINLSSTLANGVYLIELVGDSKRVSEKLVIYR